MYHNKQEEIVFKIICLFLGFFCFILFISLFNSNHNIKSYLMTSLMLILSILGIYKYAKWVYAQKNNDFKDAIENKALPCDVDERNEIVEFLQINISSLEIGPSLKPVFDVIPYRRNNDVTIYNITNMKHQDEIIALLEAELLKRKWKTIVIKFYEKENWVSKRQARIRKSEKLLRTETIVNGHVKLSHFRS